MRWLLVVILLAGCVQPSAFADPCLGVSEFGVPLSEAFWTRTTDFQEVVDAEERLASIPHGEVRVAGRSVSPPVTGFADGDGEYMDRHHACRAAPPLVVYAGESLEVVGEEIAVSVGNHHPDGRAIWTGSEWSGQGYLERTLIQASDGTAGMHPSAAQDGRWTLYIHVTSDAGSVTMAQALDYRV